MKAFLVVFILFSFNSFAQEAMVEKEGLINVEDPTNFKSESVKTIVALPVQQIDSDAYFTLARSLIQFTTGPSYYRFDPHDLDENNISSFTKEGYSFQLRGQYYFTSFFSFVADYNYQKLSSERYDGKSLIENKIDHKSFSYGIQFDLGDFIIAGLKSDRSFPFYFLNSGVLNENQINEEAIVYKFGHRTGVSNYIIELFYLYHDLSETQVQAVGKINGRAQTIGIEVFTDSKKTFGIKLAESFGEYTFESGKYTFRNLVLQPFYRF